MAVFGDYETLGGPWLMSGRHGPIRSYWRAIRRGAEDGRVYFIKSIALPGVEAPHQEAVPRDATDGDPGVEFFRSVDRLQRTHAAEPEFTAPVYQFGRTENEVWYATDLQPRRSLAEFQASVADIKPKALAHVVYGVTAGCLAFMRVTGHSHGNIKPSNVLLVDEDESLRRTPLRLTDPAGHVSDAAERRDLRGIGEIILELVETNPIDGPEDYNWPIEHSPPWRALGRDSDRWLDLCNRLLDPDLSLEQVSLEALAKEVSPRSTRTRAMFAGLGLVALLTAVSYSYWAQPGTPVGNTWDPGKRMASSTEPSASPPVGRLGPVRDEPLVASTPSRSTSSRWAVASPDSGGPASTSSASGSITAATVMSGSFPPETRVPEPAPGAVPSDAAIPPTGQATSKTTVHSGPPHTAPAPEHESREGAAVDASDRRSAAPVAQSIGQTNQATIAEAPLIDRALPGPFVSAPERPTLAAVPTAAPPSSAGPASASSDPSHAVRTTNRRRSVEPAKGSRRQVDIATASTSRGATPVKPANPLQPAPVDVRKLHPQLRELEAHVARVVAIPRNSALFAQAEALEAQYAKANQLTGKTKRRFELLRVNMEKKRIGPPLEKPAIDPIIRSAPR